MSKFDNEWQGLDQKIKLSKKESADLYDSIFREVQEPNKEVQTTHLSIKPLLSLVTVACLVTILVLSNWNTTDDNGILTPASNDEANEEIIIVVTNNTTFEFLGISINVYKDGLKVSNQTTINADNSTVDTGQELHFQFLKEDFSLTGEVSLEASVVLNNENQIPITPHVPITIEKGNKYYLSIEGDSVESSQLTIENRAE
ncbi:hypothetical protein [Gracilibacillus thailandensis]|uniref:Uncharacterized protein n=1 Tax=Gracilibacillus thailandensis TaxID=563735 RepID=A0A6N7R544_9BACI|nr:hypothetical protein [Gracilibacillus thailandensis]MRI68362.1 hypothetical protein [Gracilibacillus thailandensis]